MLSHRREVEMKVNEKKNDAISLMRFLACLLIINSHCGDLYPIPYLAIGGGQGNIIFFMLSGYCLANITLDFGQWIKKRYIKIIPITFSVILLRIIFIDGISKVLDRDVFENILFYLNLYWFVFAILLYYLVYYFIFCVNSKKRVICALAFYALMYAYIYVFKLDLNRFCIELEGFSAFKVLFYFGPFVTGGALRQYYTPRKKKVNLLFVLLGIILGLIIWAIEYYKIIILGNGYYSQILIHVGIFVFGIFSLFFMIHLNDRNIEVNNMVKRVIEVIGENTLAIYVVQVSFKPVCYRWRFPLNVVMFWIIALVGGCLYNKIYSQLKERRRKFK